MISNITTLTVIDYKYKSCVNKQCKHYINVKLEYTIHLNDNHGTLKIMSCIPGIIKNTYNYHAICYHRFHDIVKILALNLAQF